VVHEVGHQWFYNLVGNDQIDEPWLDESFAQYGAVYYYTNVYGQSAKWNVHAAWESQWDGIGRPDMPVGLPAGAYDRAQYTGVVYGRGPLFIDALAERMGVAEEFTEGRSTEGWLAHLWAETQQAGRAAGCDLPDWEDFIAGDIVELPDPAPNQVFLAEFRADPEANKRDTPSGKLELYSETIAGFKLPECSGHATWVETHDRAAGLDRSYPLALISGQPKTRLHSQLDNGDYSLSHKIQGREPVLIHPSDADARGISDGDLVEIWNDRGVVIAGARVTEDVMAGAVFLWTGAWYDPDLDDPHHRDRHGNPNVLTHDLRSSHWTQSPASHSALVELRKLEGAAPPVLAHEPPEFVPEFVPEFEPEDVAEAAPDGE
jgi:biotin/methionine sulfoxide reductase